MSISPISSSTSPDYNNSVEIQDEKLKSGKDSESLKAENPIGKAATETKIMETNTEASAEG